MGAHDTLLRCTLGSANFQLESYTAKESPLITSGVGRTGTQYNVSGRGWIEGTDAADYQTKMAAAMAAFRVAGLDFSIFELNQSTAFYSLLASQLSEGGPHVGFALEDQAGDGEGALRRSFTFTVDAKNGSSGTSSGSTAGNTLDISTAPDSLRTVGARGEVHRAGATAYYLGSILAPFRNTHPAADWVISSKYSVDDRDVDLTYELSATELHEAYPGTALVVDGEGTIERDADEQSRLTLRYTFDLLVSGGDYQAVIDLIRLQAKFKGAIIRESTRVTRYKQTRVQATFEVLLGREGNQLLNWQQKLAVLDPGTVWKEMKFKGADPILVAGGVGLRRLVQAGTAVGAGVWPMAATPLFPDHFAEDSPPQVEFSVENDFEMRTTWTYVFVIDEFSAWEPNVTRLDAMRRPAIPHFYGVVPAR